MNKSKSNNNNNNNNNYKLYKALTELLAKSVAKITVMSLDNTIKYLKKNKKSKIIIKAFLNICKILVKDDLMCHKIKLNMKNVLRFVTDPSTTNYDF